MSRSSERSRLCSCQNPPLYLELAILTPQAPQLFPLRACPRLVRPSSRRPSSQSACLTQLRMLSVLGSPPRAIDAGVRPARTSSTIFCRNVGGYGLLVLPGFRHLISDLLVSPRTGQFQSPLGWWTAITIWIPQTAVLQLTLLGSSESDYCLFRRT